MNSFLEKLKDFFSHKGAHAKNTVRYFLIVVAFLLFLFFSNDFDLINVQQTAIVMAIGIDKEDENFSVTSQIAVPSASGAQGENGAKTVNVVTQGKTIAQALDKVNEKTGWYPKLVFCRFILLGESAAKENVFDCLEYFLQDEYITDNCLIATCEGKAEQLLSTKTPIDSAAALAVEKVLSHHAQRVGTCMPNTLRLFAASYFGEAKSGFLPLVKVQPLAQQEQQQSQGGKGQNGGKTGGNGQTGGQNGGQTGGNGQNGGQESKAQEEEKVFSAGETALFRAGKQIGKLSKEETFAYALIKNKLRLAAYTLPYGEQTYTLTIKHSSPKIKLKIKDVPTIFVDVDMTAGLAATSNARPLQDTVDVGDFPKPLLSEAAKKLEHSIVALFEKCRRIGFDVCDAIDKLQKYENAHFEDKKDTLLGEARVQVRVQVGGVR